MARPLVIDQVVAAQRPAQRGQHQLSKRQLLPDELLQRGQIYIHQRSIELGISLVIEPTHLPASIQSSGLLDAHLAGRRLQGLIRIYAQLALLHPRPAHKVRHWRPSQTSTPTSNQAERGVEADPGQAAGRVEKDQWTLILIFASMALDLGGQPGNAAVIFSLFPAPLNAPEYARHR